jgi:CelD/BcsL family acetyltransferase involved in cellulose biosynthesis
MVTFTRIDSSERFSSLRSAWNELLADSDADHVFLTWEWLFTWWKHLAGRSSLSILAGWDGDRLVALLPLARQERSLLPGISAPTLEFLGSGVVGSDYLDLIVRRGFEAAVYERLAASLRRDAALLRLGQLRGDAAAAALAGGLARHGWTAARAQTELCPFIRLAGASWDSYLATLGPEHRYNVRRKLRKLEQRYTVRLDVADRDDGRREALQALIALHERRWDERGGSEAFCTPALRAFHEEWSRLALERGWLRLFVLRLDGRPAAALYGFRYGASFCFYQSGFDPQHRQDSLGLVCMAKAIERAIAEGVSEYDLLHGAEGYKFLWARETRPLFRIELFPAQACGHLWLQALQMTRAARRMARRILPAALADRLVARRRNRERGGVERAQPA